MFELWLEMWEYFYNHPIRSLLIGTAAIIGVYLVYKACEAVVRHIRFRRWANRQVWYIDGGGRLYIKNHTEGRDR